MDGPESETMPNPEPYDDRDDDSGQFRRQYSDEAFFDALDGRAFAATTDVAEAVGCSRETAYKTLQRLHDEGRVEKHNVGAAVAWSLADAEDDEQEQSNGEDDSGESINRSTVDEPDDVTAGESWREERQRDADNGLSGG